jgi:hypothetical protein
MVQAPAAPGLVVPPPVLPLGLVQVPDSDPAVAAGLDPAAGQASDPVRAQGLDLAAAQDLAPAVVRGSGLAQAQAQDLAPAVPDLAPVLAQTILLPLRAIRLNRAVSDRDSFYKPLIDRERGCPISGPVLARCGIKPLSDRNFSEVPGTLAPAFVNSHI